MKIEPFQMWVPAIVIRGETFVMKIPKHTKKAVVDYLKSLDVPASCKRGWHPVKVVVTLELIALKGTP